MLNSFEKLIEVVELREYQNPVYEHRKVAIIRTREAIYQLSYEYNRIVKLMLCGTALPVTAIFKMYKEMGYKRIK